MRERRAHRYVLLAGLIGLAIAVAPNAHGADAPLSGRVELSLTGVQKVHGYRVLVSVLVGSTPSDTSGDSLSVILSKQHRTIEQTHAWDMSLQPGDATLDRSTGTITVNHQVGPGGASGSISFTFTGSRRTAKDQCRVSHNAVRGEIKGTIRINAGDHFFKTITISRLKGVAIDGYGSSTCLAPCPRPYAFVEGSEPYTPGKPNVVFGADGRRSGADPARLFVSVFESSSTAFTGVSHVLDAAGPNRIFRSNHSVTRARATAPGGALSGSLSFKSTGSFKKGGQVMCKGGPDSVSSRPAKVVGGKITAHFDSIGTVTVRPADLNGTYPHSTIPRTRLSRES